MRSRYSLQQKSLGIKPGDGLAFYAQKTKSEHKVCQRHATIFPIDDTCFICDKELKTGEVK